MYAFLITVHVLLAVIWVGGMVFAYSFQRPASAHLEPAERLHLWRRTFRGFFPWVWAAIILLPLTGYAMVFNRWTGIAAAPTYVHLMNGLGILMILLFLHVFFAPYSKLSRAIQMRDWQEGGRQLGRIRRLVAINMLLGLVVIAVAAAGQWFAPLR